MRIGDFRVDPAIDEISRDGVVSKLEPRGMSLLLCLASHAGQVMSVDRLLEEVWKDVVVNPDSVYQTVATLRRSLQDDAKDPKYIVNVVRRGYRLIAPVSPWEEESAPASRPGARTPPTAADTEERAGAPVSAGPAAPSRVTGAVDPSIRPPASPGRRPRRAWLLGVVGLVAAITAAALLYGLNRERLLERAAGAHPATGAQAEANSVAVLPFLDLSERQDEGYFADGMSEELIDLLARDPRMHIPARTSSFYFKGRAATVAEIAKALGVNHVLEGSVRKSGDHLRVTAQLIRVDTGYHVWSQTFDRPVEDVLKIQDDIANSVVSSLKLTLMAPKDAKAPPSVNPAAYTLYLKAKSLATGGGSDDFRQAMKYLQQALVLDPGFAQAWAALADMETADLNWHGSSDFSGSCARARKPLAEALRLDPLLADAHWISARLHRYCDLNLVAAEAELKRTLELDPNGAATLGRTADFLTTTNRPRRGLEFAMKAVTADPLNAWAHVEVAFAEGTLGRLAEAESDYRRALELSPTSAGLHALLANSLLAQGRTQEAVVENEREADEEFRMMNLPVLYEAQHLKDEAQRALDAYMAKYHDPYAAALFYACRHETDRAIAYLREMPPGYILWDVPNRMACLKNLERDPRFQVIWAAQKLPPKDY